MPVASAFLGALISGLALVPAIRWLSLRADFVARPRADRWHTSPTPAVGGVAIFLAYLLGLSLSAGMGLLRVELVAAAALMFTLGLFDDLRQITPPTKLIVQIMAASVLIYFGYRIDFFPWTVPNILLTFAWLVGLTNAFNLLDNMDGLAAGVGLIAGGFLSYFFWQGQDASLLPFSLALVGSGLAFLLFNFPPARIFMGNSGSLFLGFTLAALAIARTPRASNLFAVMGVPTLLLLLPIVDTSLVTITRLLRGQSPVQGGSDHTSHRLVAFGLSERQAVLVLYAIALASGVAGTVLETLDYDLSLVLIPLLLVALALLTAYLGGLQVVSPRTPPRAGAFTRLVADLTFRRRLLEVGLDFLLIGVAFYLAVWTRFGFRLGEGELERFGRALPIALVAVFLVYFLLGVYRGVWRYVGVDDLLRYAVAVGGGVLLTAASLALLAPQGSYTVVVYFLFAVFLFFSLSASRSSFRVLDRIYGQQASRNTRDSVLLIGAGDLGELALRWLLRNPEAAYQPVGFLDEDPLKWGRRIHGVEILGGLENLGALLQDLEIEGILVTGEADPYPEIVAAAQAQGLWVRRLRFEFELLE